MTAPTASTWARQGGQLNLLTERAAVNGPTGKTSGLVLNWQLMNTLLLLDNE